MDEHTKKDIRKLTNMYRQIKMALDEVINYFKLVLALVIIGSWVYFVWVVLRDAFIKSKILSEIPLILLILGIFSGGMLLILLKLKDFGFFELGRRRRY
jgi:hypothetical protein